MKLTLAAATVLLAASSASAQDAPIPVIGNCSQPVTAAWVIGTDARNCTQQAKYTPVQYVLPNATIYETFCPNPFCRSLVAYALNFRPAGGDCYVRRTNFSALLYNQIIDPFAKNCEITMVPTSAPPVTTAPPPKTTAPPPTTTAPPPETTRLACA